MNRKCVGLFIIFLVALLAIGSVGAANLKNQDFDGYFSMKVPKDASFQKDENYTNENGFKLVSVSYVNNDLGIFYMDSPAFSENSSTWFYQTMFEGINLDLNECYETQEGNLVILEPKTIDETHLPVVGVASGNKMVILTGKDLDLLEDMGHSVNFA